VAGTAVDGDGVLIEGQPRLPLVPRLRIEAQFVE